MTEQNLFEQASRQKLRFSTRVGDLTVEDLWDLPLTSAKSASLDNTAQAVHAQLKAASTESFVETARNPETKALELKLEILKHIIAVRIAENEAARQRTERKREKERLLEVLAQKKDAALQDLSTEELEQRIEALSS